jgi:hypothetical protein
VDALESKIAIRWHFVGELEILRGREVQNVAMKLPWYAERAKQHA